MCKKQFTALLLVLMLLLAGCAGIDGNEPTASQGESSAGEASETEELYRKYDKSYSSDSFSVRKIDALAGREDSFVRGVDISLSSAIVESGAYYSDAQGTREPICKILADSGVNTVRIRLFHDYTSPDGTLCGRLDAGRVIGMIREAKRYGLKVILDPHYSDTWADPGNQTVPNAWKDFSFDEVKAAVFEYTRDVLQLIKDEGLNVDYIQIGNEINSGMIFPHGEIDWDDRDASFDRLTALLAQGCRATREVFPDCRIIIHTANGLYRWTYGDDWGSQEVFFYQELDKRGLDYDIVGASFYTFEDDTPISCISGLIDVYKDTIDKPVMIMETSYAYTYEWNDLTDNVFYTDRELPDYPVSFQGQSDFLLDIIEQVASAKELNGIGICWWGGEWIPNKDENMRTSWANQALFTYDGRATPTLSVFKECFPKK